MKEAFWGVLIVMLGLFGIVAVNLLQSVTVDNDRVYYVIKEATEASAYDSVDLTWYRLNGNLRIVEDKFIENLTRRFSQNITAANYQITVYDVNEIPPLVSLMVKSGVSSISGEKIGIENSVHGVIETKYSIDEIINFLGITKEEWVDKLNSEDTTNYCNNTINFGDDIECIDGDVKFVSWGRSNLGNSIVCSNGSTTTAPSSASIPATYAICECGKWVEKSTTLTANRGTKVSSEYPYTWVLNVNTGVKQLKEEKTEKLREVECVKNIYIDVPKDIDAGGALGTTTTPYQPSSTNEMYMRCPAGGIRIPVYKDNAGTINTGIVLHGEYDPPRSVNRKLNWSLTDTSGYLSLNLSGSNKNAGTTCSINSAGTNCLSQATITTTAKAWEAVKNGSEVTTTVKASLADQLSSARVADATCKVTLYNGYATPSCNNITFSSLFDGAKQITYSGSPKSANFTDYTWSVNNTAMADLAVDSTTKKVLISMKAYGTVTVTVASTKDPNKKGTCTMTLNAPPVQPKENVTTPTSVSPTVEYAYSNSPGYNVTFVQGIDQNGEIYMSKVAVPEGLSMNQKVDMSKVQVLETVYLVDDKEHYQNLYDRAKDVYSETKYTETGGKYTQIGIPQAKENTSITISNTSANRTASTTTGTTTTKKS